MIFQANSLELVVELLKPWQVVVGPRDLELAALGIRRIDAFALANAADVVDRVVHCQRDRPRDGRAVVGGERAGSDGETGETPAAVAAGRAEPGDLRFDDGDVERRLALQQVIRGPEAGEPGAEDRDVDVGRTVERRPRRQVITRCIEPKAVATVILHGYSWKVYKTGVRHRCSHIMPPNEHLYVARWCGSASERGKRFLSSEKWLQFPLLG